MNPLDLLISPAYAQAAGAGTQGSSMSMLFMMPIFVLLMYFMVIRPQMKRAKEHKALLEKLAKGDEILTSGGLAGTVTQIDENFISMEVSPGVNVRVQRAAISSVLPKGSLKH